MVHYLSDLKVEKDTKISAPEEIIKLFKTESGKQKIINIEKNTGCLTADFHQK